MNKYRVDYIDANGDIQSTIVEGSGVASDTRLIHFFDEYNEDNYVFYNKDILGVTKV